MLQGHEGLGRPAAIRRMVDDAGAPADARRTAERRFAPKRSREPSPGEGAEYLTAGFTRHGDQVVAALSLTLDARADAVWAALTKPESLAQWLAPGTIELRVGGRARLAFADSGVAIDSLVTAVEAPALLEYSWSGPGDPLRPVRWRLEAVGARTRLDLTLTLPAGEDAARAAAGWAAHLEMLAAGLAGAAIRFPLPTFQAARAAYGDQLAAAQLSSPRLTPDNRDRPRTA